MPSPLRSKARECQTTGARIFGTLATAGATEWSSAALCEVARDLVERRSHAHVR